MLERERGRLMSRDVKVPAGYRAPRPVRVVQPPGVVITIAVSRAAARLAWL
jgi:hypothetical protein